MTRRPTPQPRSSAPRTAPLPGIPAAGPVGGRSQAFLLIGAAVWVIGFSWYFYSLTLPNNAPLTRWEVARQIPLLLDLIDPPPLDLQAPDSQEARLLREHTGWAWFPQRLDLLAVAAIVYLSAWGWGSLLLRVLCPLELRPGLERSVFAIALGLSLLSLLTLSAGLVGVLWRGLLGPVVVLGLLCEIVWRWQCRRIQRDQPATAAPAAGRTLSGSARIKEDRAASTAGPESLATRSGYWEPAVLLVALVPFLLALVLGAALPSTDFDVNEYHFQGPKEFYQAGRISFLPHNVYTSFPFGTEMLTLLAMVLRQDWYWGAIAGKVTLMGFAPLTACALYCAGRRWFSPRAGLLAAFVHLTTPWIYRISTIAYAEGGLTCYLFLTLYAVWCLADGERTAATNSSTDADGTGPLTAVGKWQAALRSPRVRQSLLAGCLAGTAMACKYPAAVSVVLPLGVATAVLARGKHLSASDEVEAPPRPFHWRQLREQICWPAAAAFALGTLVIIGPWLLKNIIETGSPVYPLLYSVFGGRDWDSDLNAKWTAAHRPPGYSLVDFFWRMADLSAINDWLGPLLYAFAPLALLSVKWRQRAGWLWGYVGYLFVTWWVLTHRIDRFWVPMIPVVSLLAGAGLAWTPQVQRLWRMFWNCLRAGVVTFGVLFSLVFIVGGLCGFNSYLLDLRYARQMAANIIVPDIVYLNEHLPPGSKVLCVGEAQVFDAGFPLLYETVFDRSRFEDWCSAGKIADDSEGPEEYRLRSADEIRAKFAEAGVTHVLVNWLEVLRNRTGYGFTGFVAPRRFAELQALGVLGEAWQIPSAHIPLSGLGKSSREQVETWGPELKGVFGGEPGIRSFEVFPVLPSSPAAKRESRGE